VPIKLKVKKGSTSRNQDMPRLSEGPISQQRKMHQDIIEIPSINVDDVQLINSPRDFKEVNISRLSQLEPKVDVAIKLKKCIEHIEKIVSDGNDRSEIHKRIQEAKGIIEEIIQASSCNPSINTYRKNCDRPKADTSPIGRGTEI
jgi:tetrahydromethanopterin S-methyltransferase subunit G